MHILSDSASSYGFAITYPLTDVALKNHFKYYCTCGKGWCPELPAERLREIVRLAIPHGATRVILRDAGCVYDESRIEGLPVMDVGRLFRDMNEDGHSAPLTDGYYIWHKEN
ncbi:MAG: hypothetical protein WCO25_03365 [Candidatus Uhrbacteria bacterium]